MAPIPYSSLHNCTVYVQHLYPSRLNSETQIQLLTEEVRACFEDYGNILDVIVKRSNERKGQAFVVFDDPDSAALAVEELNGFEFKEDNPITLSIAHTPSDAVVEKFCTREEFEEHKKRRLEAKERKNEEKAATAAALSESKKRTAPEPTVPGGIRPNKTLKSTNKVNVVPSEYLPPNKTIMVENVPADFDKDALTPMFSQFEGFVDVRKVDVGRFAGLVFVEYAAIPGATAAKDALGGTRLGEKVLKITYSKAAA